jgi:hypothetical protein
VGAAMVPGAIIRAISTPDFRRLGLGGARRVVPCGEVYAIRPGPIGHKCIVGRGAHEL